MHKSIFNKPTLYMYNKFLFRLQLCKYIVKHGAQLFCIFPQLTPQIGFCCSEVYTFTSLEVLGALHATQNQIQATSYIFYLIFSIFLRFVSYALTHQITISYWTVFYKQELSEAFFITLTRKNIGPVDLYLKYKVRYILE